MSERPLKWVKAAKAALMGFPKEVRVQVGYALSEAQAGRKAGYAKPLTQLGSGVIEILADHDGDTFRAVYALKLGDDIWVLHAFQKKSKKGKATPKAEIDLVKRRIAQIRRQLDEG